MKYGRQALLQAVGCLLCSAVAWKHQIDLDGSEFNGGRLTGPILVMHGIGSILFVLALLLSFLHSRAAAVGALVASILCVPLYLFFTFPSLSRQVFPGEYSVPLQALSCDRWSVVEILSILFMLYLCYRSLSSQPNRSVVTPESPVTRTET